jgi:hypothetical protein
MASTSRSDAGADLQTLVDELAAAFNAVVERFFGGA